MSNILNGDFRKYMGKKFLGAWDVPEDGDLILTIDHVTLEEVQNQQGKENKMTIHFRERDYKPMICNTTNANTISDVCGSKKVEAWEGKKIALYAATMNAFGKVTEALRVRPYAPRVEEQLCEGCGKPITAHGSYSVNKIVQMSTAKYGAALCWDCASKMKAEQEEN